MKKWASVFFLVGVAMLGLILISACVVTEATNQPPRVELLSPANEATNQELKVLLEWNAQPGGGAARGSSLSILGYLVYFAMADQPYPEPEQTRGKTMEKTGLNHGTRYKWKVEAVQSDGQRSISGERFFTTLGGDYQVPQVELVLPEDGATGQATQLTLSWESTPGNQLNASARDVTLDGYSVYFARQGEAYPEPQWVTSKSLVKGQLAYGTTYNWKVEVLQSDGQTTTSEERSFSTIESSGVPQVELVGPGNFATDQATTLTLTWEATPGAETNGVRAVSITGYELYFAKATEAYGAAQRVSQKQLQKTGLEHGTQYKWKVVAQQSDGRSAASEQWVFTTSAEEFDPPQVELNTPADNATNQATMLTLTWEATAGTVVNSGARLATIEGFLVFLGKNGEGYPVPGWTTEKRVETAPLENNETYKWQVVVIQSDGQWATSTEWTFRTAQESGAPQIELVSPADFATEQATTLTLTWEATPGADTAGVRAVNITGYDVYFAKATESYASPEAVTGKQLQKSNLEYATQYKWKVVARQSDGKETSSEQWVFSTVEQEHSLPEVALSSPPNSSTDQATTLTLTWEATPGTPENTGARTPTIQGFFLYFGMNEESYTEPQWSTEKQVGKTQLEYNTTYKWKVAALQSDGKVATSAEWTFVTAQENGAPEIQLITPTDFSTGQATTLTLTWEATSGVETSGARALSITGYDLFFAPATETFGLPEQVSNKEFQKSNLEYGTTYKWKVVAKQSDGKTASSEQWVFSTAEKAYSFPQVSIQGPSHEATMVSRNPTLTWEATPGTQSNSSTRALDIENFEVYFAKAGEDYAPPVLMETKYIAKENLVPYSAYKWKVRVNQSDGQQTISPEAIFQTAFTFLMGNTLDSPDDKQWGEFEKPVHGVALTYEFQIGKYEVTFDQYDAYLLATGQPTSTVPDNGWGRGSRPVVWVSWEDAVRYCNWLSDLSGFPRAYDENSWELLDEDGAITRDITKVKGWRLPTEAEWEYSARGGAADITDGVEAHDYLYAGSDTLDDVGWYSGNSGGTTHPVGEKDPNEWGLYDMTGNVWEMCHDGFDFSYYESDVQTNPLGVDTLIGHVVRGGCCIQTWSDSDCRVSYRFALPPNASSDIQGFRLSRTY
ncbi:MAG TPA: SUMF1/EgtB/PvdO family nonheme iron enzyme [Thermotogota bacterium]|nr:SUMF1/EgtB/PvdO family nonheme iron enzyme [Thermotogota bacterium]HRW93891.1 SUMF1/EgtB/PvdO family nonheme iron enzyme [Thermotogota bacterium]